MKHLTVMLGVAVLSVGLVICHSDVWGADWKELAEATTGIFHYDAASVSSPSKGVVRVWLHNVTKNESRLVEFNCSGRRYHVLDTVDYDEAGRMKRRDDHYDNPEWLDIPSRSVPEALHKIVCP